MPQIPSMGLQARRPWRKVLYVDQGVPDNYVDESFLDEMKKNRKSFHASVKNRLLRQRLLLLNSN